MNVEFIAPAAVELDDAVDYYNIQSAGLGQKFLDEVIETIGFIEKFPQLWSRNTENTRKAILRKYPFNLIYSIFDDKIYIIAVAHQNREPEYWIDRI
jgi:hypothetical protein